jgi:hypothetical protein
MTIFLPTVNLFTIKTNYNIVETYLLNGDMSGN